MTEHGMIVVGVDGSPPSREALLFALREAVRRPASVTVVRAFEPPDFQGGLYRVQPLLTLEEITRHVEAVTWQVVHEVLADHDGSLAGVEVDVVAVPGSPSKVLLEQARFADLLVVGHRGLGGFASATLGSVGLQCALHAPCPITVVRPAGVRVGVEVPVSEAVPAPA
jgi:nucleotide-binding universal stress UspA family protein